MNDFCGDGILTAIQISKYCKKKNITLNDWLKSSFDPFPQKLTNIKLDFNINKINPETKILIDQTIQNYQSNNSEDFRIYIRPSGTEPVIRILVEADNQQEVNSISTKLKSRLSFELNKIIN